MGKPKFNVGERVHILPDVATVYEITKVHEGPYQFFYDVREPLIKKIPESELKLAF